VVLAVDGDVQPLEIRRHRVVPLEIQHLARDFPANQFATQTTENTDWRPMQALPAACGFMTDDKPEGGRLGHNGMG
jgi:hypothetical protein